MSKMKTKRQVGYLLSKRSPLTGAQKNKLEDELRRDEVKVVSKRKSRKR
jgi:hypothetical protein